MQPVLLIALDPFVAEDHSEVRRPEALLLAFRDWATGQGYLEPTPEASE